MMRLRCINILVLLSSRVMGYTTSSFQLRLFSVDSNGFNTNSFPTSTSFKKYSSKTRLLSSWLDDKDNNENKVFLLPEIHPDDIGKKCLVLDLDETLIHCDTRVRDERYDYFPFSMQYEGNWEYRYIYKRPGVVEFIEDLSKHYEIVLWTAGIEEYADKILEVLDPKRFIRTRLSRESCEWVQGTREAIKDLRRLGRDLSQTVIVDDNPTSFMHQQDNGIECQSYYSIKRNDELQKIKEFLIGIKDVKDVRGICPKWRDWPNITIESTNMIKRENDDGVGDIQQRQESNNSNKQLKSSGKKVKKQTKQKEKSIPTAEKEKKMNKKKTANNKATLTVSKGQNIPKLISQSKKNTKKKNDDGKSNNKSTTQTRKDSKKAIKKVASEQISTSKKPKTKKQASNKNNLEHEDGTNIA